MIVTKTRLIYKKLSLGQEARYSCLMMLRLALSIVLFATFSSKNLRAQVYAFTDENAFTQYSDSINIITFNGLEKSFGNYGTDLSVAGVNFTSNDDIAIQSAESRGSIGTVYNSFFTNAPIILSANLSADSPVPYTAAGIEVASPSQLDQLTATVTLANGVSGTYTFPSEGLLSSSLGFIGFDSLGAAIASISIVDPTPLANASAPFLVFGTFTEGRQDFSYYSPGVLVPTIATAEPKPLPFILATFFLGAILLRFTKRLQLSVRTNDEL